MRPPWFQLHHVNLGIIFTGAGRVYASMHQFVFVSHLILTVVNILCRVSDIKRVKPGYTIT
jgi:hypothetical protein